MKAQKAKSKFEGLGMGSRVLFLIFLIGTITGCTWSHPYKGDSEFYSDKYDCEVQVNSRTPQQRPISPQEYAAMSPAQRGAGGAYQGGAQLGTGINQMFMFSSCMKSKGWQ